MSKYALPVAFAAIGGFTGGLLAPGVFSMLGASIGLSLGTAYFGPQMGGQGGSAQELRLASVDYGGRVPDFYGLCRTAGTWIDCHEDGGITVVVGEQKQKTGTGKKKSATAKTYNYFLTGAYALGEGLLRVDKVWADTKLIYNRNGANDDERGFTLVSESSGGQIVAEMSDGLRLYRGSRRQMPDSVLKGLHGGKAPAYRGTAYLVFNNFDLLKYGNRIPTFTAQVARIDENGNVIDDAAQIITLHARKAGLPPENLQLTHLVGKKISGAFQNDAAGARGLMEQIARWHYCGLVEIGGVIRDYNRANPTIHELSWDELGAVEWNGGKAGEKRVHFARGRTAARQIPSHVILRRIDPNLDFDFGTLEDVWQTAPCLDGSGTSNFNTQTIDLQIVASDAEAAPRLGIWKDEMLCARATGSVTLDIERLAVSPGDVLKIPTDESETNFVYLLIEEQTLSTTGLLTCTGSGWDGETYTRSRAVSNIIRPPATVEKNSAPLLALIDTATLDEEFVETPCWIVAASAPSGARWSGADFEIRFGGRRLWNAKIGGRATMGTLDGNYSGAAVGVDYATEIRVVMEYGHLASAEESAVLDGANLLAIGNRLIRFVEAVEDEFEPGTYTLSGIVDAALGTDWTGTIPSGARVVLLTDGEGDVAEGLEMASLKRANIGQSAEIKAWSSDDDTKVTQITRTFYGNNLKALAPVNIAATRQTHNQTVNGVETTVIDSVTLQWTARTRYPDDGDGRFSDMSRLGLSFDVELLGSGGAVALTRVASGDPAQVETIFTAAQLSAAGLDAAALDGRIVSLGSIGRGFSRAFTDL